MASTTLQNRYKDFDISLTKNPKTGDIYALTDVEAVKRSVRLLILTQVFERPFHPEISSAVYGSLFDNFDTTTSITIQRSIKDVINNFEPRATLISTRVVPDEDNNSLSIYIYFYVVNVPTPVSVQINLERVR